ncbi:MAG TPA: hypothetical protein VNI20_01140 [Fimbriimonadaceae bacterium]|nr:hypothetical protein [Fimbriimonadaceae bacterium]
MLCALLLVTATSPSLLVVTNGHSDLVDVLKTSGANFRVLRNAESALERSVRGDAVLILADDYPTYTTLMPSDLASVARKKGLHVYVEFPDKIDGYEFGKPQETHWERVAVARESLGTDLHRFDLMKQQGAVFLPVKAENPWIVYARLAGFDTATYGFSGVETFPALFEDKDAPILIATSKLSEFVTGRFAPTDRWTALWDRIFAWLGVGDLSLHWRAAVHPAFAKGANVGSADVQLALKSGIDWYVNSKMLVDKSWEDEYEKAAAFTDRVAPRPRDDWPCGDGSYGVLEGFSSNIALDGEQMVRWWRRSDCNGETAGAFAVVGARTGSAKDKAIAKNLCDFLWTRSIHSQGDRADPKSPAYGLLGWNDVHHYYGDMDGYGVFYGDDNARAMLGTILAAGSVDMPEIYDRVANCLWANLRTTGKRGFRHDRIDMGPLVASGWKALFNEDYRSYAPHYQAYLWACFLWAYAQSGEQIFLDRTRDAISEVMQEGEKKWRWTNGLQQERGRMLLPLAWLVRVDDTPQHRKWLSDVTDALLADQDEATGAIPERLGSPSAGMFKAAASNAEYGKNEAPLIQQNGDKATDSLYTLNFVFLGLNEAYRATGEEKYKVAADKIEKYFVRTQIRSERFPWLNGAWFRAFDFGRWDYWASNGDAGWGAWSIETGWTQAWILSVMALRLEGTSLWKESANKPIGRAIQRLRSEMLGK